MALSHLEPICLQDPFDQSSVCFVHFIQSVGLLLLIVDGGLLVGKHKVAITVNLRKVSTSRLQGKDLLGA